MEKNQQYNENAVSKFSGNILRLILATIIICGLLSQGHAQDNTLRMEGGEVYIQQGASIYIQGKLKMKNGSELSNDGLIHIEGNLSKSNGANYNDTGLGTLSLDTPGGAATQSIEGDFTGTNAIGNLILGSAGANSLIELESANLEVTNALQLTDVILRTDNESHAGDGELYANEIYITNPAPDALQLSGNPENTYVEGKLRRAIASGNTYTFDMGSGIPERASFELNFHTAPPNFDVLTYFQNQQSSPLNMTVACGDSDYNVNILTGKWITTPSQATGYTYDIALTPNASLMTQHGTYPYNLIAEGDIPVGNCSDDDDGNGFTGGSSETLQAQNLSNLSYFDIFGLSTNLAIELERIWAESAGNNINVYWTTASETNNTGFELQRSTDASNFERIAWIDGQGNSTVSTDYKHTDTDIREDVVYYYRIKAIGTSGKEEYSPIVSASLGGEAIGIRVFPNPVRQQSKNLSLVAISDGGSTIEIFNEAGQLVFNRQFTALKGEITNFAIPPLAAGMHIVTITNGEYIKRTKLMVAP